MKIAWASNAPWASTGYGQQTAQILTRLRDAGHDVACIANYGLNGAFLEWEGIRIYPAGRDQFSNDVIPGHALHWFDGEPGLLIALYDAWALRSPMYRELDMAVWCPVDHQPAPVRVAKHFEENGSTPIAMSRWGEEELRAYGLKPLYAPHGIDTRTFRPHPKDEAKRRFGISPDVFLVGMVSTNNSTLPIRKAYPEAFAAFSVLRQMVPESLLYVHAEQKPRGNAADLVALANARAIPPESLLFVDEYRYMAGLVSSEEMAWLYSAFDVLLFPSMGEGFGIPAIEAQSCGTPIIVCNFSAQTELVAPGTGYLIANQPYWDSVQKSDFCIPLIEDLVGALVHAATHRDDLGAQTIDCREFALEYDADRVFEEHWVPTLAKLEGTLPSVEPIEAMAV